MKQYKKMRYKNGRKRGSGKTDGCLNILEMTPA